MCKIFQFLLKNLFFEKYVYNIVENYEKKCVKVRDNKYKSVNNLK